MISDQAYLNWNDKLSKNNFFRAFWKFWAIDAVWLVFLAGIFLLFESQWKPLLLALAAFVFARLVISPLIYVFFKTRRPYQKLRYNPVSSFLFSRPTAKLNAFPSDHAISFAAIAGIFLYYFPAIGLCLLAAAVINGIARIILGYHYVYQILGGWVLGFVCAFLTLYLSQRFW